MAYANGLIPSQALVSIGGGQALELNAARSWVALTAAAKKAGFTFVLTDSYRPRSVQERIFFQRYVQQNVGGGAYGDVRMYQGKRYVRKAGYASAATPGTSNHGTGTAIDIAGINAGFGNTPTNAYQWLAKHASAYGWTNPAWAKTRNFWEPWHWEYDKAQDRTARDKTIKQLAAEVLAGEHGTGNARKNSLGSQYAAVQAEINRQLGATAKPPKKPKPKPKSVSELAAEVIAGKHGTGDARKKSLGRQFTAVQAEVNRQLARKKPAGKSVSALAAEVIKGEHGTGSVRKKSLGSKYAAVQAQVNRLLRRK